MSLSLLSPQASWLDQLSAKGDLRPYVYIRKENQIKDPGQKHQLDWFTTEPLFFEALSVETSKFGDAILDLENKAFGADLAMPKWVFYDCALVPGFVCGFAMKKSCLPASYLSVLGQLPADLEWVPLSLFIMIPSMHTGEWIAHNLCAINHLVPLSDRLYGLGFLTKAFGLWYANVDSCVGMTQWGKAALKLHSHFGYIEVLTAYTPIHTYARTMTYRCQVNTHVWQLFFKRGQDQDFIALWSKSRYEIDPRCELSMQSLQQLIEAGEGPFYLSPEEIASKSLQEPLHLYQKKGSL